VTDEQRTRLLLLVSGRFRLDLSVGSFVLENEGNYALWGRDQPLLAGRRALDRDHCALAICIRHLTYQPRAAYGGAVLRKAFPPGRWSVPPLGRTAGQRWPDSLPGAPMGLRDSRTPRVKELWVLGR
jgi:hypothetical protein